MRVERYQHGPHHPGGERRREKGEGRREKGREEKGGVENGGVERFKGRRNIRFGKQ